MCWISGVNLWIIWIEHMTDLTRTLNIFADGEPVAGFRHARVWGHEALELCPWPFLLKIWNLSDESFLALSRAKRLSVVHDGSELACGTVSAVFRKATDEGRITTVSFSPGLPLWEAPVSLSAEAGVSVSETVRRILAASGTGISLVSWSGEDPVFSRGPAFFGRAAECVSEALSAVPARAYLTQAGLCAVPSGDLPASMVLTEEDLLEEPAFPSRGVMVLRTRVVGWTLGKTVSVTWKGKSARGLVTERSVSADNTEGPWQAELVVEVAV